MVFSWLPRPQAKYHRLRTVSARLLVTAEYS